MKALWFAIMAGILAGFLVCTLVVMLSPPQPGTTATNALAVANTIIEAQRRTIALSEDLAKVDVTCVTFEAMAPGQESIWARIGELQLCGRGLVWSMARGPSYSAVIANRDAEIAALRIRIDELVKGKP